MFNSLNVIVGHLLDWQTWAPPAGELQQRLKVQLYHYLDDIIICLKSRTITFSNINMTFEFELKCE